jgi:peptidyl-prolyl cis-trans isomerase SurA
VVSEIKKGADFPSIARQFSESASAAQGGDMGWMQMSQLDPEIASALDRMQIGEISPPVRTVTGYHILWLREKRTNAAAAAAGDTRVTLRRLLVPVAAGAPDLEARTEQAKKAAEAITSCNDLPKVAGELGAAAPTDLGTLKVTDLAPQLQPLVANLQIGHATAPVPVEAGLAIMVVCGRSDPTASQLPSRDQVANKLLAEKLDGESRKYLRDLRQAAYIDIRA